MINDLATRYMLFGSYNYYPNGGMGDYLGGGTSLAAIADALHAVQFDNDAKVNLPVDKDLELGWFHIYDCDAKQVIKAYGRSFYEGEVENPDNFGSEAAQQLLPHGKLSLSPEIEADSAHIYYGTSVTHMNEKFGAGYRVIDSGTEILFTDNADSGKITMTTDIVTAKHQARIAAQNSLRYIRKRNGPTSTFSTVPVVFIFDRMDLMRNGILLTDEDNYIVKSLSPIPTHAVWMDAWFDLSDELMSNLCADGF